MNDRISSLREIAASLFLVLGLAFSVGVAQEASTTRWFGTLDTPNRIFRFYVTVERSGDDFRGRLLSLDEGMAEFELQEVLLANRSLEFKLPATGAEYVGERFEDDRNIAGKWLQRNAEFKLNFRQVEELPEQSLQAYWVGQINAGLQKLEVAIRELQDGTVLFDSVTQRAGGFVTKKSIAGSEITFEVPSLNAIFSGKLNKDGDEIIGTWNQGPVAIDLTLKRSEQTDELTSPPQRPQNPIGPFPYAIEKITVANPDVEGVSLAGTLTIPRSPHPVPAVILISGSGPQDRDETIFEHKPFWILADHLSRNKLAVIRFDDRGVGESTGDFNAATSEDFASDVSALVQFIRKDPRIDAKKIALCGHSEGGIVAPMVAAQDPQIAALVLMAAPGVTGEKVLVSQARLLLEAAGVSEDEIVKQLEMQRIVLDLAKRDSDLDKETLTEEAIQATKELFEEDQLSDEDLEALVRQVAGQVASPWFRFFLTYDPAVALKQVRCPTLVLNGSLDLQVDADLNVKAIEKAFADVGFNDYEVIIHKGLNHLFQTASTGSIDEYAEIEETISPSVLEAISRWLNEQL